MVLLALLDNLRHLALIFVGVKMEQFLLLDTRGILLSGSHSISDVLQGKNN